MKYDRELMHFGIKGMHWGIRRSPEQLGHRKKSEKDEYAGHKRPVTATKTKNPRTLDQKLNNELADMSDDELRQVVNRMNLERQYKDLRTQDINRGKNAVQKFVERNAKAVVDQEAQKLMRLGIDKAGGAIAGEFVGGAVARGVNRR